MVYCPPPLKTKEILKRYLNKGCSCPVFTCVKGNLCSYEANIHQTFLVLLKGSLGHDKVMREGAIDDDDDEEEDDGDFFIFIFLIAIINT